MFHLQASLSEAKGDFLDPAPQATSWSSSCCEGEPGALALVVPWVLPLVLDAD